jgi:low temperature requirement protein LtrA
MAGRDIDEAHRVSTPLELLFDLTVVVAIAAVAAQLHHAVAEQHLGQGLVAYLTTFASIWWAWMTYTWFASAYDTDDTGFRLATMVQMVGVLILAAGVPRMAAGDPTLGTLGYVVMRVGLVSLWWRAAREHPERRRTAMRYVVGILAVQTLWVARLALLPEWALVTFFALGAAELMVPVWAAKAGHTPWHAHHIAERYGLFTIIVLGECVLGTTTAISGVLEAQGWSWSLVGVGGGGVALILALWWVYFLVPSGEALHHHRERAFRWGYGHYFVFASLAALGAFLGAVADRIKVPVAGAASVGGAAAGSSLAPHSMTLAIALVAAAVAVYLTSAWAMSAAVTRVNARLAPAWLAALALLAAVVAAVAAGLPLAWAIAALPLAPAVVIAAVEHGKRHHPERFRLR